MAARLSERFPSLDEMVAPLESLDRRLWAGHHQVLQDATHVIGGVGLGFLLYSTVARWARPLGMGMVFLSTLLHIYAFFTSSNAGWAGKRSWR